MEFFIALICNLVALAIAGFAFLAFNASGGIFGKSSRTVTGALIALVVTIISGIVSYNVMGGAGLGATILAAVLIFAFIVFKPIARIREWNKRQ